MLGIVAQRGKFEPMNVEQCWDASYAKNRVRKN